MGKISRQPQLLTIVPGSELEFKGDPKEVCTSTVQLRNDTDHRVGFKVMTNAPHLLFVSPTNDVIEPGGQSTIRVKLQPSSDSADANSMRFLKLLIQSLVMRPEFGTEGVDKLITLKNNSEEVMETKLSCVFKEVYTSELDFPLTADSSKNQETVKLSAAAVTAEQAQARANPNSGQSNLSGLVVKSVLALLIAILAWYFYSNLFGGDDDGDDSEETPPVAAADASEATSGDRDGD